MFLDVPFDVTAARMAIRDGTAADPGHPSMRRYVDGQRIYYSECSPMSRATAVVDNSDPDSPMELLDVSSGRTWGRADLTIEAYTSEWQQYLASSSPPSMTVRRYLDFAALTPRGHVLELGSGPGWDADYLEERGLRVGRTDASPAFVGRLHAAGHDARILDVRSADYGGPFDGLLANAVLLHLSRTDAEAAFRRARLAVRAGGVLGLTLKEADGSAWSTAKLGRPRHFTYWREPELVAALIRAGWTIHSLQHVIGRHEPWIHVIARTSEPASSDE